jgi:hypothetical protein
MAGIAGIGGYNTNLLPVLSQAASDSSNPSLSNSSIATGLQSSTGQSTANSAAGTSSSSDLQNQIRSAVSAALQGVEESGNTDLKGVVYKALIQVLQNNGIDPKTLKPTDNANPTDNTAGTGGSQHSSVDSGTSNVLAEVLSALNSATAAASDPLTQLLSSQNDSQGSSNLISLLGASQAGAASSSSLSKILALENGSQGSADLLSLFSTTGSTGSDSTSQDLGNLFSTLLPSQNNKQNLLGFLYDSGQ